MELSREPETSFETTTMMLQKLQSLGKQEEREKTKPSITCCTNNRTFSTDDAIYDCVIWIGTLLANDN